MALKLGASTVDALYLGASAVDAAYLGASEAFETGYAASAVVFVDGMKLTRAAGLTGVTDSPAGFISIWTRLSTSNRLIFATDGEQFSVTSSSGNVDGSLWDEAVETGGNFISNNDEPLGDWSLWHHKLIAWNTNFTSGSRKLAYYFNDILQSGSAYTDEEGGAYSVELNQTNMVVLWPTGGSKEYADFGLWLGSTIVENDGTISEVNRRKFIDAEGKPVDPTNWPASPVIKMAGDATAFATNQGSGGAFVLSGGSITNALTSPSD